MGKMEKIATPGDSLRIALSEAIANHKERSRELTAATAAVDRAYADWRCGDPTPTRKAGFAAWRTNQVSRLHAAATTGKEPPQESGRAVRAAAEDAPDEIESAKSVLLDCKASLASAEDGMKWSKLRLESAVRPVLTSEISSLIATATDLRDRYHEKCATLIWLLPNGDAERNAIHLVLPPPLPPTVPGPDTRPAPEWLAAKAALMVDSSAPLPTGWCALLLRADYLLRAATLGSAGNI
jgi:hypothetical protein